MRGTGSPPRRRLNRPKPSQGQSPTPPSFLRSQSLFSTRGFSPISFERAAAYTRLHRFLAEVEVPQGAIDMTRNLPTQDLTSAVACRR